MDSHNQHIKKEAVQAAIKEILCELRLITPESGLTGLILLGPGGVMDSLTAMRFISAAEKRFGIDILTNDINLDCLNTAESLAAYILAETSEKAKTSGEIFIGHHMTIDCSQCTAALLNDADVIQKITHLLAAVLGAQILTEGRHIFSPVGITYFAVVSASHIAVHTWPEYGYVGVDIFSCRAINEKEVTALLTQETGAGSVRFQKTERKAEM